MLFTTAQFALFLGLLLVLLRVLPRRSWNGLLLAASLVFYTMWRPAYLPLLLLDIGVNYALLRGMLGAAPGSRRRRTLLLASIVFTLGLLLYFKYALFLVESAWPLLAAVGLASGESGDYLPGILLPLGISFYTFQIISLSVDAATSDDPEAELPIGGLGRYALFVSFFPQLIAGPILRGSELLLQLERGAAPDADRRRRGLWLIASGLVKKIVLADFLLAPFVDSVFGAPGVGNRSFHWVAMYGFAFQIYFDFSGYTDIARGVALLIGFELPMNFNEPFLSRSPREFWRRWHMTLTRWLQLYVFTPLGRALLRRGPRWEGPAIPIAGLATMTLCGLWHGAGWTFVVWGLLQGILLVVWRVAPGRDGGALRWRDAPLVVGFFHAFALGLVVFRCPDLEAAARFFEGLVVGRALPGWPVLETAVVVLCAILHPAERWARLHAPELRRWVGERAWGATLEALALGLIAGLAIMTGGAGGEFIYFQF